ncbi:Zn-ribbon domain-containing OB-fold protein [Nocardioides sp. W7]|uniref:Zn-ribbon domain-containing OB-fold protein n=1 Tax=Nocardioides sp. W7 TaxID=2931390 RepID=UPI001FD2F694|nr:Zn-ribbon domain-containing OB-fold protein [Nocardioides sp. W7]
MSKTSVPPITRTHDNVFWFDGAQQGRLLIQRCADCATLRHPPGPACPACRSFEWDTMESSRRGTLHSFTVIHHPQDPAFTYPLAVGLIDLAEGTRLVADIEGVEPGDLQLGMELEVVFGAHAHDETLPRLRPVPAAATPSEPDGITA